MENWNPEHYRIFETITGSRLYGTNRPDSDLDTRGICIPPTRVLLNPFYSFDQKDSGFEEDDRVIYSLQKFFKLCADANPNIIELLFAPEKLHVFLNEKGAKLLNNSNLFVSKKVKFTFTGYAFSQLNDIKRHRQWFINPPKEKPTRKMFGLTDSPKISGEGLQAVANIAFDLLNESFADEIRRELAYRDAKQKWDNYISWRDNRNPARRALEEKWGYDVKHAMHLFRLMTEGKELLLTGKIIFPLQNRDWLMEILYGSYSYEKVLGLAENMEKDFEEWYKVSNLPNSPDKKNLEKLYYELIGV